VSVAVVRLDVAGWMVLAQGLDVYACSIEVGDLMLELVFDCVGNAVRIRHSERRRDLDREVGL
jgi:hypothetical protein